MPMKPALFAFALALSVSCATRGAGYRQPATTAQENMQEALTDSGVIKENGTCYAVLILRDNQRVWARLEDAVCRSMTLIKVGVLSEARAQAQARATAAPAAPAPPATKPAPPGDDKDP